MLNDTLVVLTVLELRLANYSGRVGSFSLYKGFGNHTSIGAICLKFSWELLERNQRKK